MTKRFDARRALWASAAVLAILMTGCRPAPEEVEPAQETTALTIASFGGSFQDALQSEVIEPIAREIGVEVSIEAYGGEYDRLAATIRDGSNPYDLVHVESSFLEQAAAEGLSLPMDWDVVDRSDFVEGATQDHGLAMLAWALVPAWNTSRVTSLQEPVDWTDFFAVAAHPGPRCLRKTPEGNLELALLADGVPPEEIYEGGLDVERALAKLSSIKPQISWWSSGAELEQKLTSSCAMAAAWNGRVLNLKRNAGQPVELSYDGSIHQFDWWIVPSNSHNADAAMRFLAEFGSGVGQEAIAEQFGYGPVAVGVVGSLSEEMVAALPSAPDNLEKGVRFDPRWWAENQDRVQERWNTWLLED